MGCSEAQRAANRRNAAKSTGPRTPEGKAIARRNSLKHGLTGEGIVLPHEDEAALAARFAESEADLKPRGGVDRFLVRRAALLSVRLDRAALHEAACLSAQIHALDDLAVEPDPPAEPTPADCEAGMDALFEAMARRPLTARAEMIAAPDGVERLIAALLGIQARVANPAVAWSSAQGKLLGALLGPDSGAPLAAARALGTALLGDFSQLETALPDLDLDNDLNLDGDLDARGVRAEARQRLAALIAAEVERLHALLAEPPAADPPPAPADSDPHRVLFDPSPDATRARRYEAATERAFFQTLRALHQRQKQRTEPAVNPVDPTRPASPMGSFRQPPPEPPRTPDRGRPRADQGGFSPPRPPESVRVGRPVTT